jgi:hypothetical protein
MKGRRTEGQKEKTIIHRKRNCRKTERNTISTN